MSYRRSVGTKRPINIKMLRPESEPHANPVKFSFTQRRLLGPDLIVLSRIEFSFEF